MIRIVFVIVIASQTLMAQGADAHWPTAAKNGFGTSTTLESKVWFTLANGVMTEVFFPRLDVPNVQMLQLLIMSDGKIETEIHDTVHTTSSWDPQALTFLQINVAKTGLYSIIKTYITDPSRHTVLIEVSFRSHNNSSLYVYYDPSLNNSGMHDSAWTTKDGLVAADKNRASALVSSCGFTRATNGYFGSNDGLSQLRSYRFVSYPRANNGNVVQVAQLNMKERCTLALGFGENTVEALNNARASLASGYETIEREYKAGWHEYCAQLPRIGQKHQQKFDMAAMVLKGLEDKTFRGASIASPSAPWGGGANANEPTVSGYHAVWARDLYHVATAFDAMGDRATANRLLDYLFRVQQKRDGSFPQNSWVDGRPIGRGLQMDQVGLALVLAYQLGRNDRQSWLKHIKPAANFILRRGPRTDQDRWEEKPGYSPSTIAAEIAGLVCAAEVARLNGDSSSADTYLKTADNWAQNVERWTVTGSGYTNRGYYLRITENDDPNDGAKIHINSSNLKADERKILDAGFLELVRLGVKDARDPLIVESLALIDQMISVETPVGKAWYRYNHDAYGETPNGRKYDGQNGVGRLWTLLTGERGEYEIAAGDFKSASRRLDTMAGFANEGLMIPEQVWDLKTGPFHFGAGTGSATPLAWSMAQFIRLAMNIERGRNLETPKVVRDRYVSNARARFRVQALACNR